MMIVVAPAKLNLTLEVIRKLEDGYHEIRSVVQTINFCDTLKFSAHSALEFRCNWPKWSSDESLVSRAASLMQSCADTKKGALVEITKRIPLCSGLGGDSSDAAAVLRGLNMLWSLKLSLPELLKLAKQLGSDVPLFLHGGTMLLEGRGETITPVTPFPHSSVVILMPRVAQISGKTGKMYSRLTARNFTKGEISENFINLLSNKERDQFPGLFNVFDSTALRFFEGLKNYRKAFLEVGAEDVHVAGAGPALFTLVQNEMEASKIHQSLLEKGLEAHLTDF